MSNLSPNFTITGIKLVKPATAPPTTATKGLSPAAANDRPVEMPLAAPAAPSIAKDAFEFSSVNACKADVAPTIAV